MAGENEGATASAIEQDIAPANADEQPAATDAADPADETAQDAVEGRDSGDPDRRHERNRERAIREREQHRRTERELQETREQLARLAERTDIMLRDRQAPAPAQPQGYQPPDPTVDPVGATQWVMQNQIAQQRAQQEQYQAWQRQQAVQAEQQRAWQKSEQAVARVNQEFMQASREKPEINEALQYVRGSIANELQLYGYTGQALEQERLRIEREHILQADRLNVPIDEYVSNLASTRGWQRTAMNGNGRAQQQATGADQVKRAAQARDAGQSLSRAGGTPAAGAMTAERLMKMTPEEFDEYRTKNPTRYRQIMGG